MMFTKKRHFDPSYINTIEKDATYHGHWWIPNYPDDRVSGVLYLQKTGGIKLHLIGMFKNDASDTLGHRFADHDLIIGELVPGNGSVTLVHCRECQRESPYLSNVTNVSVQRFKAEFLIFGYRAKTISELRFKRFEFSTTYLTDWINSKQLDISFNGMQTVVSSLPRTELSLREEGYKIAFSSWASTSLGGSYNSSQYSSVTIDLDESISFEKFKEVFQIPILDLVQFGSSLLNSLTFLNGTLVGSDESLKLVSTSEFDQITRSSDPTNHHALFLMSDLEDTWDAFTSTWLKYHKDARHIFRLYFDSMHISFQFPVTKFLNIAQSVESYHALRTKNDDITLRVRLDELLAESNDFLSPIIKSSERFITKVINTRNYYTHYNSRKKTKAAEGLELHALTHTMRLLLNFHLLVACKLEKDKCAQLILRNDYFISIERLVEENNFWKD